MLTEVQIPHFNNSMTNKWLLFGSSNKIRVSKLIWLLNITSRYAESFSRSGGSAFSISKTKDVKIRLWIAGSGCEPEVSGPT